MCVCVSGAGSSLSGDCTVYCWRVTSQSAGLSLHMVHMKKTTLGGVEDDILVIWLSSATHSHTEKEQNKKEKGKRKKCPLLFAFLALAFAFALPWDYTGNVHVNIRDI